MDLEELRTVRDKERRTDSLQHLRDEFYDEATEYVRQLKRERGKQAQASGDPYTPEAMRLTDEIDAAEETIESLYERRRGKLVKLASFAAAGNAVETDGMTEQEQILFDDLVDRIEANERRVFDAMEVETAFGSSSARGDATAGEAATGTSTSDRPQSVAGGGRTASSGAGENGGDGPTIGSDEPESVGTDDGGGPGVTDDDPREPVAATTASDRSSVAESAGATDSDPATSTDQNAVSGAAGLGDSSGAGDVLTEAMGGDGATDSADTDRAGPADGPQAGQQTERASASASPGGVDSRSPDGEAGAGSGTATGPGVTDTEPTPSDVTPSEGADRPPTEAAAVAGGDARSETPSTTQTGGQPTTGSPGAAGQPTPSTETTDESQASDASDPSETVDRETIRVTEDVGEVYGVDERSYELAAGDTVLLPSANAEPLVDRDAAERL